MSYAFDGVAGSFLSIADDLGITTNPVCIFAWMKLDSDPTGWAAPGVSLMFANTTSVYMQGYISNTTGMMRADVKETANVSSPYSASALPLSTWMPVFIIDDGSGYPRYVSDVDDNTGVSSSGAWITNSSPSFYIGGRGQYSDRSIAGKLAHVTVLDNVPTSGAIPTWIACLPAPRP